MSLTLDQLPKIQEQIIQALKDLLALEEVMLPAVKADIKQISDSLTVGFNQTNLKNQALKALNTGLNESQIAQMRDDATRYQEIMNGSISKLIRAMDQAEHEATRYQMKAEAHKNLYVGIISGALCFVLGAALLWGSQSHRIDRYQYAISQTDSMARFVNSDCRIKQIYGDYIGKKIDCKTI